MTRILGARGILAAAAASVVVAALAANAPGAAAAQAPKVYTVANFPVDAVAKDAVTAKRRALADGDVRAFRSLVKRLVPVTAYARLPHLGLERIQDLIKGFRVRDERNSATEYLATLDYTFRPRAVRALLRSYGLPFIERQAPPTILVPVYRDGAGAGAETGANAEPGPGNRNGAGTAGAAGGPRLRPPAGAPDKARRLWHAAWRGLDLAHALTPLRLKAPSSRVTPELVQGVLAGDATMLQSLAETYGQAQIVIAVAEPSPDRTKLQVTLAGRDAVGPIHLARAWRIYDGDFAYTAELAAVVGLGVIEGRWKAVEAQAMGLVSANAGPPETVRFTVLFNGLGAWQAIRRRLAALPGVENLDVGVLSARGAEISLDYPGGTAALARALAAQGLMLGEEGGTLVLRASDG